MSHRKRALRLSWLWLWRVQRCAELARRGMPVTMSTNIPANVRHICALACSGANRSGAGREVVAHQLKHPRTNGSLHSAAKNSEQPFGRGNSSTSTIFLNLPLATGLPSTLGAEHLIMLSGSGTRTTLPETWCTQTANARMKQWMQRGQSTRACNYDAPRPA